MEERIALARKGREVWLSLIEQYHIDANVYVILLPSDDKEINGFALKYLDDFLKKRFAKEALILSYDSWVKDNGMNYTRKARFVEFDKVEMEQLIQFYCLYEFAPNLVIASLEEPAGRLGNNLIGHKGLSKEEIFKTVIYRLW